MISEPDVETLRCSVGDVVFGFDQSHLVVSARQPELERAVLDVNGQEDGRVVVVDESDETHLGGGGELDAYFQPALIQRLHRNTEAQERIAVEVRIADFLQPLAAPPLVAPVTPTLQHNQQNDLSFFEG